MDAESKYIVVLVTVPAREEAERIARGVLEEKLAACVNIIPGVDSYYWWQGKIDMSKELLLVIKTQSPLFSQLKERVASLHSYDVPEIIAMPLAQGSPSYLNWINESVRQPE